jgi:Tfp pilus assembly protein PilO
VKAGRRAPKKAAAGRSSNRAVIAMAVMGSLVLLYGWNSFFLAPRSREKAQVAKQFAAARKQEDSLRQSLTQLRKLAADTRSRESELARLGRLVPADADTAGAILALDRTAKDAQVAWSSFNPAPLTSAPGGPSTMVISVQIGGTFHQILDYVRRLEELDRLVVVDGVSLSSGGTGAGSPTLAADIKARMFAKGTAAPATVAAGAARPAGAGDAADAAALIKEGK